MDEKLIWLTSWKQRLVFSLLLFVAFAGSSEQAQEKNQSAQSVNVSRQYQTGFISIDCGAAEDYVDNQTGIFYESDSKYIGSGTVFQSILAPGPFFPLYQQQHRTFRSFPGRERNCYTLRPENARNNKYLIRSVFSYANNSPPPIFDLYLGVNKLGTVIPPRLLEIIYVPTEDEIEVCLVKTGRGDPYITALELRPLDNSIYPVQEGALGVVSRVDFGALNKFTRFPDDAFDRIWIPDNVDRDDLNTFPDQGKWSRKSIDPSLPIGRSEIDAYALPDSVLRSAVQTNNISIPLNFGKRADLVYLDSNQSLYAYFHFMETESPEPGKKRELSINSFGTSRNLTSAFLLEYLKPLTVVPNDQPNRNIPVNYSTTSILPVYSVVAAEGSTLPPILNGAEIFLRVELPLSPTNHDDVNAMTEIDQMYRATKNWNGDPCLPSFLSWDGLICSNDSRIPRVISLNLSSSGLAGHIPYSIYKLRELQNMDLSYNNLTGQAPDFLEDMPNLKVLNITGNNLQGSVPAALVQKSMDGTLLLRADGNRELCHILSCQEQKTRKGISPIVATIVAVVATFFLLSMVFLCIYFAYLRKSHGETPTGSNMEEMLQLKNRPFTYEEIVQITGNFKTVIGEGGFGKVYLGTLNNGTPVAVKLLSESSNQGYKEFRSEAQLLMVVHHRNLVSLAGYCDEGEHMALIYEYMINGNLKHNLSVSNTNVLTWNKRLQIAVDAAQGLEYLHNGCKPPIVHRDLKPSNILLNENMQAKIADFGLSRLFTNETASHMTTTPAGTFGYLDPEYHASGSLSKKSDVYSFGIILLEIITGRPAIMHQQGEQTYIVHWINPIIEAGDIRGIVDPRLQGEFSTNSAWRAVEVAMLCIASTAARRPDMSYVLAELKECAALDMVANTTTTQITRSNNIRTTDSEMLAPRVR